MSVLDIDKSRLAGDALRPPPALAVGLAVAVLMMVSGNQLLEDPDLFWHIAVGNAILDTGAMPRADIYSFTMHGTPWLSSSWLSQVAFAAVHDAAGWAGPVALASLAIGAALGLFVHLLARHIALRHAVLAGALALVLSLPHCLARPHILAMPVMVAFVGGLIAAADRRDAPSPWLLPLMTLWANLHGGFITGLALIAALGCDAVWNAAAPVRLRLAARWAAFGLLALGASCLTPYGWRSLLAARTILDLGDALRLLVEWRPADFSVFGPFEAVLLLGVLLALATGVRLPLTRALLLVGFLHMALAHVRTIESFALLVPLLLAKPLAARFGAVPTVASSRGRVLGAVLVIALGASVMAVSATRQSFAPDRRLWPEAATTRLVESGAKRIFNDYAFGGYLILRGVPTFIDGRAELYGAAFLMEHERAVTLEDVDVLLAMLAREHIDATLLRPSTPAARLMDHLDGWQRVYADDVAVAHRRRPDAPDVPRIGPR